MAELKTYRRRQDKYGYFTLGYFYYIKALDLYSANIREFEMFRSTFGLEDVYREYSQKYNMLHYFDLKEKTIEIKFLDKETSREVMSDTYSLSTSSYMIVRETVNYDADLKTTTIVNPATTYEHVAMYSADRVSDGTSIVKVFRNKTDFMSNYNCVYTISDNNHKGTYFQIESDISNQLLKYNNSEYPTINTSNNTLGYGRVVNIEYKSNRDIVQSDMGDMEEKPSYIIPSSDDVMGE